MTSSGFVSPSTGRPIKAVLFDTFGTVVDWRTGVGAEIKRFAEARQLSVDALQLADAWRAEYQPSMERVRSGDRTYVPLDQLHYENLIVALEKTGIRAAEFEGWELRDLNRAWEDLPAWPDSRAGIDRLRDLYIVGPLSNGNTALLLNMAKNAGLHWDLVLGLDLLRAYKPDPAAYLGATAVLRLDPGEVMLVAAHNSDLRAARQTGLATAFVCRGQEHGPGQIIDLAPEDDWDVCVDDFVELADALT